VKARDVGKTAALVKMVEHFAESRSAKQGGKPSFRPAQNKEAIGL